MPVLFSGASTGPAKADLGKAFLNLGMTIYDKLNKAEVVSQFQTGQMALSRRMNQFDQDIARDPDIDSWADKNVQAMDSAWQEAQPIVKNPQAANALNEWWVGQKVAREAQTNDKIVDAKGRQLYGQFLGNVDSVLKSTDPSAKKKADIEYLGQGAMATMLVDSVGWESFKKQKFDQLDENDFLQGGVSQMTAAGKEEGIMWMQKNFPEIPQDRKEVLISTAELSYNRLVKIADTEATATNSKVKASYIDIIMTDPDFMKKIDPLEIMNNPGWAKPTANVDAGAEKKFVYDIYYKRIEEMTPPDEALVPYYTEWDELEKTKAQTPENRIKIKEKFVAENPKRTSTQVTQLDTYLDPSKKRKPTDDEEDELMRPEYIKFTTKNGVIQDDAQVFKYQQLALSRGLSLGGVTRWTQRLEAARNLTDDQKSQLKVLTNIESDYTGNTTQDQKNAASRAYSTVIDAMHGKPDWLNKPGGIQKYAMDQYNVEIGEYIKGALDKTKSMTHPGLIAQVKQFFTGKASPELMEAGRLIQEGRVDDAALTVSANAVDFENAFFDQVKTDWVKNHPKDNPVNLDSSSIRLDKMESATKPEVKYKVGKRPLAMFQVGNDDTGMLYQQWMNPRGLMEIYSLPAKKWIAEGLNADSWKKVQ